MNGKLTGRIGVVSGASRGVGSATAQRLAQAGAQLVLAARDENELVTVAQACSTPDSDVITVRCDVTRQEDVGRVAAACREQFGRIDFLVNNAGVGTYAEIEQLNEMDWLHMIEVNLTGVYRATRALLPLLRESDAGQIVNMSSVRGIEPIARTTGYAATKAGVIGFSQALAKEVGRAGIRVTTLCPGGIRSHFGGSDPGDKPDHFLRPEDVSETILYCLSVPSHVAVSQIVMVPFEGA